MVEHARADEAEQGEQQAGAERSDRIASAGGQPTDAERPSGAASAADQPTDAERAAELLLAERRSIDNIDSALVHILAERFRHTQRVGRLKAEHGLPAADPSREAEQVARLKCLADESGLDPVFAERFLKFIVTEVIRHHEQIRDDEKPGSPAQAH